MLTRKGALLGLVVVLLAGLAVLADSWVLALAVLALVAVLAQAALVVARAPPIVVAHDLPDDRFLAGDAPVATVRLTSGRATGLLEVAADPPATAAVGGGTPAFLARVGPRAPVEARYELRFPVRGRHRVGAVAARLRGPFGLFERRLRAEANATVTVLPAWEALEGLPRLKRRPRVEGGAFPAGRLGAGQEFFGLRGYLPGDPMDAVNWKQTAKRSRPIVNEHEQEVVADLVLVLDARAHADVGAGAASTLEAGVRAVASLSALALAERAKVGLVVLGDGLEWLYPRSGAKHHDRIVERLLEVGSGGSYPLTEALPRAPPAVLPRGATVVLVTPAHVDPALAAAVEALHARGLRVLVVSPSPEAAETAHGALGGRGRVAARLLALDRARYLDGLRVAGADHVVDWDPATPLATALLPLAEDRR